jgi:hypothetical protein
LRLEGVQRRFTRLIDEVGHLPYSERLEHLGFLGLPPWPSVVCAVI